MSSSGSASGRLHKVSPYLSPVSSETALRGLAVITLHVGSTKLASSPRTPISPPPRQLPPPPRTDSPLLTQAASPCLSSSHSPTGTSPVHIHHGWLPPPPPPLDLVNDSPASTEPRTIPPHDCAQQSVQRAVSALDLPPPPPPPPDFELPPPPSSPPPASNAASPPPGTVPSPPIRPIAKKPPTPPARPMSPTGTLTSKLSPKLLHASYSMPQGKS